MDVVLLDLRLPDCDDLRVLSAIRRLSPHTPVILMTAYGSPELFMEARRLGAFAIVDKPFDMEASRLSSSARWPRAPTRFRCQAGLKSCATSATISGNMPTPTILVVDDEQLIRWSLTDRLKTEGYNVVEAATAADALAKSEDGVDLVLLDYRLPDGDGLSVLKKIKERTPDTLVIMLTAYSNIDTAVEAMKQGAYHYANKPFNLDEIALLVEKALETTRLRREVRTLRASQAQPYSFDRIVGESPALLAVKALLQKVASSPASTVLLTGESGTGKDLAAKAIHYNSSRASKPFMNITCSALPESLLESELFGHERGAFTGADRQKRGLFEMADGGTVFLDEIGEMVPALQAKLLRFLEEKTFKRVGGATDIHVDVRVISATNRNLQEEVRQGKFREDLFYRLNVLPIALPPLRDRADDIARLVTFYIDAYNSEFKKRIPRRDARRDAAASAATRGPATSASFGTRLSGRCCWPKATR